MQRRTNKTLINFHTSSALSFSLLQEKRRPLLKVMGIS